MTEETLLTGLGWEPLPPGSRRSQIGRDIYKMAETLFPHHRSITGPGVRRTLACIQQWLPGLQLHEVPTGTQCFDWVIPKEWSIDEAWLEAPDGRRVIDLHDNNLHVMNYSTPVDMTIDRSALEEHLYSLPDMPDAIPYVTSYYKERWGFCLTDRLRRALPDGKYRAVIRSRLEAGSLTYGELVIPGRSQEEILLSTYICHPSMANNETSGMAVTVQLAQWLQSLSEHRYTYRIVFCPETVGTVAFLSQRHEIMRQRTVAGFVLTMIGDDRGFSCTQTPTADTIVDRVSAHVIRQMTAAPRFFPFTERASDERQYCAPGIGLPVVALMRAGRYPEYHTSADDLALISPAGLYGGFEFARLCIATIEANCTPRWVVRGEPQMIRHGLRNDLGARTWLADWERILSHLLAFADGKRDLIAIADLLGKPVWSLLEPLKRLEAAGLLTCEHRRLPTAALAD